jgi:endonuclease/exonuclease/phosphatase family metal-dependent hydrolase
VTSVPSVPSVASINRFRRLRGAAGAAAAIALLVQSACARQQFPAAALARVDDLACRQVVPAPPVPVRWITTADVDDQRALSRWCETVGAVYLQPQPAVEDAAPIDRIAVVTWNIHEGGGDVDDFIRRLRAGALTSGEPVDHFVLLLQEARRRDATVPPRIPPGYPSAAAIAPRPGSHDADLRRFAEQGLAVLYAPSMRNGRDPEDRGNLILSTLPLRDPRIIELPLERQRRVSPAVAVEGRTSAGRGWHLDLADVHLDTALALGHGGPFAARRRQAAALLAALAPSLEQAAAARVFVLAGDFNTWMGGGEAAIRLLSEALPDAPAVNAAPTWRGPLGLHATLDHVFIRGRVSGSSVTRLSSRFGSDHYPLLAVLRF